MLIGFYTLGGIVYFMNKEEKTMNKSVFVTGANIGTGLAIAEKFAKEGQNVVFTGRNIEKVRLAERNYREKFPDVEIKGFAIDSLIDERTIDEKAVKDLFSELDEKGIFIETLVLNAADQGLDMKIFENPVTDLDSLVCP